MNAVARWRPRRMGSDEAHAWARNLRLGNAHAKYVLCMLTLYVNGDGICFVSIPALADDCELAPETVRRRLAWLEDVGAIVRLPQWIDEAGRRNGEGRGRRTSDEIRLCIEDDGEGIEARALAGAADPTPQEGATDDHDPIPQTGANEVAPPVRTPLALQLRTGAESSEPEPEGYPPNPPKGGGQAIDRDLEKDIAEAQRAYPAPVANLPRLRAVMATMPPERRRRVLVAMRGYAAFIADCERKNKNRAVKDADRWVSSGMWEGYVAAGEAADTAALAVHVAPDSPDGRAWRMLHKIAGLSEPEASGGMLRLKQPLTSRQLALAETPDEAEWAFIAETDSQRVGAWREFLRESLDRSIGTLIRERSWRRRREGEIRAELAADPNAQPRRVETIPQRGFIAPWPWPPAKDGKVYVEKAGPPDMLMTEKDLEDAANQRW